MLKSNSFRLAVVALFIFSYSCKQNASDEIAKTSNNAIAEPVQVVNHVMTQEQQDNLTPQAVLHEFIAGNVRFNEGSVTRRDHNEQVRRSSIGQFPKAVILSCLDSRIPVEDVFDQGIGDIFVGRVAGNFVNEDILGSMEFACKVSGAKLIVIMGHQHCGAIKGAIDGVKLGNITAMLSKINPAVEMSQTFEGEKSSKNEAFVKHVCENNIRLAIKQTRQRSEILNEMEKNGKIKIIGAMYNLTDGKMTFLDEK